MYPWQRFTHTLVLLPLWRDSASAPRHQGGGEGKNGLCPIIRLAGHDLVRGRVTLTLALSLRRGKLGRQARERNVLSALAYDASSDQIARYGVMMQFLFFV